MIVSTNEAEAFKDVDVAILIAGYPPKSGMKRTHIIDRNVEMYKRHGQALAELASKKVKVELIRKKQIIISKVFRWLLWQVQQIQMP